MISEKPLKIFNCTVSDGEREGMILSIDFECQDLLISKMIVF